MSKVGAMEMKTERLQVVVEPAIMQQIDDFRFGRRIASRSDAVRQLLIEGLRNKKAEVVGATPAA